MLFAVFIPNFLFSVYICLILQFPTKTDLIMFENNDRLPSECTNIAEVRNEIDNIDKVIIRLLSARFEYVKEVVKYKEKTANSIEASGRRNAALADRRKWAEEAGLSPDVVEEIYDRLIRYFIEEEKKIMNI